MSEIFAGYLVTKDDDIVHPKNGYTLHAGDLILKDEDGTWSKHAPGIGVFGFELTEKQEAALKPVNFVWDGHLGFKILKEESL